MQQLSPAMARSGGNTAGQIRISTSVDLRQRGRASLGSTTRYTKFDQFSMIAAGPGEQEEFTSVFRSNTSTTWLDIN